MLIDKYRARSGGRRISEITLLGWALLGGAMGAAAAAHLVRHKTRKQPFAARLRFLLWAEIILLTLWAAAHVVPHVAAPLAEMAEEA